MADVPLDAVGLAEASALGQLFKTVPLVAIVSSPLKRARATAQAVSETTGAPMTVEPRLVDRDYGEWDGCSPEQLVTKFGSVDRAPGVEEADQVARRALQAFNETSKRWNDRPIAFVSHDAVLRGLLVALVPTLAPELIVQPTGCWHKVVGDEAGWEAVVVGAMPSDGRIP